MAALVKRSYEQHKEIILAGERWFIDVGNSLMAIREEQLYKKAGFDTFEACVAAEFSMGMAYAYRLIESVVVIRDVSPIGDNGSHKSSGKTIFVAPENESQARAVADVADDPHTRQIVWAETVEQAKKDDAGKPIITAALVKKVAKQIKGTKNHSAKAAANKSNGRAAPLPISEREPGDDDTEPEHDQTILDALDIKPLSKLRGVFGKAKEFRSIINAIGAIRSRVNKLHSSSAGGWLPMAAIEKHLDELQRGIKFAAPHTECANCQRKPTDECKACEGTGWVTEVAYNQTQTKEGDEWLKNR